ncbi:MAG: SDR family oxidoreductase [Gemmatimonadaceae bacterium]
MILVAGATGALGGEICRRLIARREPVRALVRATSDPAKVEALSAAGCNVVVGDLKHRPSLDQACQDVDAVISTVSMIGTGKPGDSFEATDERGTLNLIAAAKAAQADHFIYVSFDTDSVPDSPLRNAKAKVEEALRASSMTYTILQPSYFMESWLGPHLGVDVANARAQIFGSGDRKMDYVSLYDVAELAVQSLTNPAARNVTIRFGGPQAVTQREAIRAFEQAAGRAFQVQEIPEQALEAQYQGATDPMQRTFAALMLGAARGHEVPMNEVLEKFPIKMTTVREFAERSATGGRQ